MYMEVPRLLMALVLLAPFVLFAWLVWSDRNK
jgi:hypothetical protein